MEKLCLSEIPQSSLGYYLIKIFTLLTKVHSLNLLNLIIVVCVLQLSEITIYYFSAVGWILQVHFLLSAKIIKYIIIITTSVITEDCVFWAVQHRLKADLFIAFLIVEGLFFQCFLLFDILNADSCCNNAQMDSVLTRMFNTTKWIFLITRKEFFICVTSIHLVITSPYFESKILWHSIS